MRQRLSTLVITFFFLAIAITITAGAEEIGREQAISDHKPLTNVELYSVAQKISVQVLITDENRKLIPAGSGVWIKDGIVATCFHVVKDSDGPIIVNVHMPTEIELSEHKVTVGPSLRLNSSILASDPALDLALLRIDPNGLETLRDQKSRFGIAVAALEQHPPESGSDALLAGYPFGSPALLPRKTSVAGLAVFPDSSPGASELDQVRIFIGVSSTLGDSGGPVLDQFGKVIGLVQGNLPSPDVDEQQRPVIYIRPVRDSAGNFIQEPDGKPKLEATDLFGRAGIAAVVPAYFVSALQTAHGNSRK